MADSMVLRGTDASTLKRPLTALDDGGAGHHPSNCASSTGTEHLVRARVPDYAILLAGLRSPWRMSHPLDEPRRPSLDLVPRGTAGDRTAFDHIGGNPLPSLLAILAAAPAMTGCGVGPRAQVEAHAAAAAATFDRAQAPRVADERRFPVRHHAQASLSTLQSTDSTDSSPTTTISTVDSSSITDSSPGSSPESPTASLPLAAASIKPHHPPPPPRLIEESSLAPPLSPYLGQNGPLSPGRRPRNTKNLSLNMSASASARQFAPPALRIKTASAADTLQSAPASPSVATAGMRPPKKRPSHLGLSVRTATMAAAPSGTGSIGARIVPPSPRSPRSARPNTLRHHQSSPALSLFSPTMGVPGGMQLPPLNPQLSMGPPPLPNVAPPRSRPTSSDSAACFSGQASPIGPPRLAELEEEGEDEYAVPLSQEVKSPAYPAGPVCIYEPHVYLYLEPSGAEASQFDVILNVAREVKNPFAGGPGDHLPRSGAASSEGSQDEMISRSSSSGVPASGDTAPALMLEGDRVSSPIPLTAKPPSFGSHTASQGPEYMHIPWDHNSNIVDDMLQLVEVIDERVRQGKRVLVHCQCGVSRSASLIVAYGLYRDPSLTVQEVYDAVKRKSRWIGPNMSLIYQLSEFRTKMIQRRGLATSNPRNWRGAGPKAGSSANGRANTLPGGSDPPLFAVGPFEGRRSAPQTAPLPGEHERGSGRSSPSKAEPNLRPVKTDGHGDIAPGPSSAPSGVTWEGLGNTVEMRDAPCRSGLEDDRSAGLEMAPPPRPPPPPHAPPREAPTERSTSGNESILFPQAVTAPPPDPTLSLMSPRASSFTANLLHEPPPPAAPAPGSSSSSSARGFRTAITIDPRSPAHHGEAPIVRSIFDVL